MRYEMETLQEKLVEQQEEIVYLQRMTLNTYKTSNIMWELLEQGYPPV